MKKFLICLISVLTAVLLSPQNAYSLTGAWRGDLSVGKAKVPLVFNFFEKEGRTKCTLDSPAQGVKGISVSVWLCTEDSVSLACSRINMKYNGKVTGNNIVGAFKQNGQVFPLTLEPETPLEERRPQTPRPPFPYTVVDTSFTAPDGAVMSATLTLPASYAGKKKVPAVVFITGSGPQNRDEELLDHKPFAVIADYLARNGVASLRYDDRGTAKSTGDFSTATTAIFKEDARSGIEFLRQLPGIGKAGVIGHSEGGTIAFMLGAERSTDFLISLGGMAESGKETLMRQNRHGLDVAGIPDAEKEVSLELIGRLFDTIEAQARYGVSEPVDVDSVVSASGLNVPPAIVQSLKMTQRARSPWFDAFLSLNPREYIRKIKCPVLAMNGDKDTQVSPDNLEVIRQLAPTALTMLMPGLNHLFQHAVTGEISEYDEIRETISPEVLEAILRFIEEKGR